MQEIELAYEVEHTIKAPLMEVFAFFSDIHNYHNCTADVVYFEVKDERTSKWQLETKEELGLQVTPEYTLRYDFQPENAVSWQSIDGNVHIDATLRLSPIDNYITRVVVREEVAFTLPVSVIMAKIIKTVAAIETRKGMLDMLKNAGKRIREASKIDSNF